MAQKSEYSDKIKDNIEKLQKEVKTLGMILGLNKNSQGSSEGQKEQKTDDKNQYHKEVTADDKKARKAAKAAEKKARAEKSIAGKAAAAAGPPPQQNNQKPKEKKKEEKPKAEQKLIEERNELTKETEKLANEIDKLVIVEDKKTNGTDLKSAIKKNTAPSNVPHVHRTLHNGVHFNMTESEVRTIPSDSDEGVASEIESTAIAPLDDALCIANIHPAFLTLLAKADVEKFADVETACVKFLEAFQIFLRDWTADREKSKLDASTYSHDLDLAIRPQLAHLTQNGHWPLPFALGNTVRLLKRTIKKVDDSTNARCEESLQLYLEDTLSINFSHAYKTICHYLFRKIQNFKKIAVFDWCPVVNYVLLEAKEKMPELEFTVIEGNRKGRGMRHVKSFTDRGWDIKYCELSAASWACRREAALILGCSAIFANGAVAVEKGGLASVLCANHYNIPVIVVAEHFKFIDKGEIYQRVALLGKQKLECVPSDFVTAVVTDIRVLGPTAAPAVLKAKALTDMA